MTAGARVGDLVVAGLVAVNSAGAPGADDARAVDIAAARTPPAPAGGHRADTSAFGTPVFGTAVFGTPGPSRGDQTGTAGFGSTTIGLVATNAALDKLGCHLVAQAAHDGLARSVFPAHGRADGDAFVAAAVGSVPADVDAVRGLAVHVVARAISDLAGHGTRQRGR